MMLNLKALLAKILEALDDILDKVNDDASMVAVEYSLTAVTVAAGTASNFTETISAPSGYTKALGIVGYSLLGTNASSCNMYRLYLSGTTVAFGLRNTLSSTSATPSLWVRILWAR